MKTAHFRFFFAAMIAIAGCATVPTETTRAPVASEVSPQFRNCYAKSKRPWLVEIVAGDNASPQRVEKLIADLVAGTAADRLEARRYLSDLRSGLYANAERMAAAHFGDCITTTSSEKYSQQLANGCYKEQRILFSLMDMRLDRNLPIDVARTQTFQIYRTGDPRYDQTISRLVRDTYATLKPGGANAYAEAQFQLCMTVYQVYQ